MSFLIRWWRDLSVAKKLYGVVGIMALLIAFELATLSFAMNTLSAVRAFVGGEGLWSKGQKDAAYNLQRFVLTRDEVYYQNYLDLLKVPLGSRKARIEMAKPNMDREVVRAGFLEGRIHPKDIDGIINLFRRFHMISYIDKAIQAWADADPMLDQFLAAGDRLHKLISGSAPVDYREVEATLKQMDAVNAKLTVVEDEFSYTLGEGSRWLENLLMVTLLFAVLTVELTGLLLAATVSRNLSRGLAQITEFAGRFGKGDFSQRIPVHGKDEVGQLSTTLNKMSVDLESNITQLRATKEDSRLRDEFLSLASHELKTPITSLRIQLQMVQRRVEVGKAKKSLDISLKQIDRLTHLVEDLLDVSKIEAGKLSFQFDKFNASEMVLDVIECLSEELMRAECPLQIDVQENVWATWDHARMEQVLVNLITNAIKYASGSSIKITLRATLDQAQIIVEDKGPGIAPENIEKIFNRFERATHYRNISGLGLGLFIVKQIITSHSGTIRVESNLGTGARFIVDVPQNLEPHRVEQVIREISV